MKVVLQRVLSSRVEVAGKIVGQIDRGWLVLIGLGKSDTREVAEYVADRCIKLRGVFQADMQVTLTNDGPVTFIIEKNA